MPITGNFEHFEYFNFETTFLKNEIFFQKTKVQFFSLNTKIENASFPFKTVMPEVNLKANRMGVRNGSIKKNGVLPVTALFFQKFCFSLRTFCEELI